ncbi:MAG: leucyl aminopeptidase [Microthrixaceae bacterium]|nr:leucyl aminopeptidase [Microthrixaceae bacterium]
MTTNSNPNPGPKEESPAGATPVLSVKVSASAPAGATAVGEFAYSDRLGAIEGVTKAAVQRGGFEGKPGSVLVIADGDRVRVLCGLGAEADAGAPELRKAVAAFTRAVSRHRKAAISLPEGVLGLGQVPMAGVMAEAAMLANYSFVQLRSDGDAAPRLNGLTIVTDGDLRASRVEVTRATAVAEAVCFARDMVNAPGGSLTPERFAEHAVERASGAGLSVEVLDADAIAEARLGGILAVNKGSSHPPRLVKLTYEPSPEALAGLEGPPATVALVGKGITFDSGGLSIKPADSMVGMKMDMGGAAAVIAAICALPALGVPVRVVSFTPMTDNMTGPDAQRPGDVYTARNGTTVEVINTDAEGRLILGEALVLASEVEPDAIVDVATLTGACMVALGERIAGLMSNDDALCERVRHAAQEAGERVWPLPLPEDYASQLDSDVADVKNIGTRYGGTLTAGLFLKRFVASGIPWAHLDIAGPGMGNEVDGVNPKGGTGFGVRTLCRLLADWHDAGAGGDVSADAD